MTIKNDDLHTSTPRFIRSVYALLLTSKSIADDATMADNCEASMWKVISSSLDIDLIHGDIHDPSRKKSIRVCAHSPHHNIDIHLVYGQSIQPHYNKKVT